MTKVVNYKNLPHSGYLLAMFHGIGPFIQEVGNFSVKLKEQQFNDSWASTSEALWFETKGSVNKYYCLYGDNSAVSVGIVDLSDPKTWDRVYKMMKGSKD